MHHLFRITFIACCIHFSVIAVQIETFYGSLSIEEPVLVELIESPAFKRLKHIHQYGVAYYTTHRERYNRYDHSLGVFYLLRQNGCSLEEQIAGLLHDVSHTIFSHVGDWIFNRQNLEFDYQTITHRDYLEKSGLGKILRKYGYTSEQMEPKQETYPALEQPLPNLCADRLDYNIQGAYHQGYITYEEALSICHDIQYVQGEWISHQPEIMKKLALYSFFMTQSCWGSPTNYVQSMWLAKAILRAVEIEHLSMQDVRFGIDHEIWSCLLNTTDPQIQENMQMVINPTQYYDLTIGDEAHLHVHSKFRGINPIVDIAGTKQRLNEVDPMTAKKFEETKALMKNGWAIQLHDVKLNLQQGCM